MTAKYTRGRAGARVVLLHRISFFGWLGVLSLLFSGKIRLLHEEQDLLVDSLVLYGDCLHVRCHSPVAYRERAARHGR